EEEEALNSLLDAFGSLFSLNDIASAYCEAGRNPDLAGLILCEMQGIPPLVATDQSNNEVFTVDQLVSAATDECSGKRKKDEPMESSCCNSFQRSCEENGGLSSPKQKARPVSGGTVSSMLGKGYMKSVPLANGSYPGTKPMKVDSKEMPMSLFWGEELEPSSQNEDRMHKDMEDFLFKMLGEGFRLERDMIREIAVDTTCKRYGTMDNILVLENPKFAVDAFAKGDQDEANKLLEQVTYMRVPTLVWQGQFFQEKARQADEESNQKIFETRLASCSSTMFAEEPCWFFHSLSLSIIVFPIVFLRNIETEDEMLLELHNHGTREAIQLLKCHLSSLAGIPC
ncbi:hypothetical protein Gotur_009512, partial [Gossypium turneri]